MKGPERPQLVSPNVPGLKNGLGLPCRTWCWQPRQGGSGTPVQTYEAVVGDACGFLCQPSVVGAGERSGAARLSGPKPPGSKVWGLWWSRLGLCLLSHLVAVVVESVSAPGDGEPPRGPGFSRSPALPGLSPPGPSDYRAGTPRAWVLLGRQPLFQGIGPSESVALRACPFGGSDREAQVSTMSVRAASRRRSGPLCVPPGTRPRRREEGGKSPKSPCAKSPCAKGGGTRAPVAPRPEPEGRLCLVPQRQQRELGAPGSPRLRKLRTA